MAQLNTGGNLFSEDVTVGASVTYAAGGIKLTLTESVSLKRVVSAVIRAPSGTGAGTILAVAPVAGSEASSPPSFFLKAYETGAAVSTPLAELAAASTALQGVVISVLYEAQN